MPTVRGQWKLVRIFIGEGDRWHGRPLYEAIVFAAREMGVAGATVLRGIEGYGADSVVHSARVLRLSQDLPIVVEVVDREEMVEALIERVESMLDDAGCGAMITIEEARVIRYRPQE